MAKKASIPAGEAAAVWVALADLKPWDQNPRRNDHAVAGVVESIRRFGFGAPILARRADGEVIAGHTRLKAAQQLGLAQVPVRYLDLDPADAHLLALADNKTAEAAEWDEAALADLLRSAAEELDGADLVVPGFDGEEIAKLVASVGEAKLAGEDPGPEAPPAQPQSRRGELYELGTHRLLCGDSTDLADVQRLLGTDQADMVWTDPPYGVAYVGKTADALTIENDALDENGLERLLAAALGAAHAATRAGGAWYVSAPGVALTYHFEKVLRALGVWRHTLIWVKDAFVLGRADYHYRHEPVFYG